MELNLDGSLKTSGRSQRLVVTLSYLPPEALADEDLPEEWTILRTLPQCPTKRCHKDGKLCDECWWLEHVNCVGLEYIVESLEWEGRGKEPATVILSGHMVSEAHNGPENGWEYDEFFDLISYDIKPPEPEGGKVYGLTAWEEGYAGIED